MVRWEIAGLVASAWCYWLTLSAGSTSRNIPPTHRAIPPSLSFPHNCRPQLDCIVLASRLGQAVCSALRLSQNIDRSPWVVDFILDATVIEPPISLASALFLMPPNSTSPSATTKPDCSVLPPLVRAQCERVPSPRVLQHQIAGTKSLHPVCWLAFSSRMEKGR